MMQILQIFSHAFPIWIAYWKDLGVGAKAQATIESFFNFIAQMTDGFDEMGFGSDGDISIFETMDRIGDFPIYSKSFEGGEVDVFSLDSITERQLDFDPSGPPKGYRQGN